MLELDVSRIIVVVFGRTCRIVILLANVHVLMVMATTAPMLVMMLWAVLLILVCTVLGTLLVRILLLLFGRILALLVGNGMLHWRVLTATVLAMVELEVAWMLLTTERSTIVMASKPNLTFLCIAVERWSLLSRRSTPNRLIVLLRLLRFLLAMEMLLVAAIKVVGNSIGARG